MYINIRPLVAVLLVLNIEFVQCKNDIGSGVIKEGNRRLRLQNREIYEATDDKLRDYLGYYGNFLSEKDRNWCPKKCNNRTEILVSPNFSAYCTCNKKGETVHHQCKKTEIFNGTTSSCTPLLGNGRATCVLRNKTCPHNRIGIEKHPNSDLYQNYIICMENDVIVAKCEPNHYFKESQNSCVKIGKRKTILSHSDCEESFDIKCTIAGVTKLEDHPSFTKKSKCQNCYVICSEKNKRTFDLMIQCNKRKRILPFLYDQPINDILKIPEEKDKARHIKTHTVEHLETKPHENATTTYDVEYNNAENIPSNKTEDEANESKSLHQTADNLEEEIVPNTSKYELGHILIKKKLTKKTKEVDIPISVDETNIDYDESQKHGTDSEKTADNSDDTVEYKEDHILTEKQFTKRIKTPISVKKTKYDESEKGLSEEIINTDNEWDKFRSTKSNDPNTKNNIHDENLQFNTDYEDISEEPGTIEDDFSVDVTKIAKNKKPKSKVPSKIIETVNIPKSEETISNDNNNTDSYEDQHSEKDDYDHLNKKPKSKVPSKIIETVNIPKSEETISNDNNNTDSYEDQHSEKDDYDHQNNTHEFGLTENAQDDTSVAAADFVKKPIIKKTKVLNKPTLKPWRTLFKNIHINKQPNTATGHSESSIGYTTHDELEKNEPEKTNTEVNSNEPVVGLTIEKKHKKSINPEILDDEILNDNEQKTGEVIKIEEDSINPEPLINLGITKTKKKPKKLKKTKKYYTKKHTQIADQDISSVDSDKPRTNVPNSEVYDPITNTDDFFETESPPNSEDTIDNNDNNPSSNTTQSSNNSTTPNEHSLYTKDSSKSIPDEELKPEPIPNKIIEHLPKKTKLKYKRIQIVRTTTSAQSQDEPNHYFEEEHPINFETSAEQPLQNINLEKKVEHTETTTILNKKKHYSILVGKPSVSIHDGRILSETTPKIETTTSRIHTNKETVKSDNNSVILVDSRAVNSEDILLKEQEKNQDNAFASCNVPKKDRPCPNKGFQRYKGSCSIHYECYYKKECNALVPSRLYQCPHCLQFNAKRQRCDLPQNVPECTYHEEDEQKFKGHRLTVPVLVCSGPGIFKDPGNPTRYFKCVRVFKDDANYLTLIKCPTNQIFNDILKKCVPGDNKQKMNRRIIEGGHKKGNYVFDKYSCWRFFHNAGGPLIELHCPDGYIFNGKTCENIKNSIFCNWEELKKYLYNR